MVYGRLKMCYQFSQISKTDNKFLTTYGVAFSCYLVQIKYNIKVKIYMISEKSKDVAILPYHF